MATAAQQDTFISKIKNGAINGYKKYGVYASVSIAQAAWESGWGLSGTACVDADNNLFGIKYDGNHAPGINITKGSYATDDGGYYAHYESWGDSIEDHGYFLRNNSRYADAGVFDTGITADEQITRIMNAGYAGTRYDTQAISIMKAHNLYQYDTGQGGGGQGGEDQDGADVIKKALEWAKKTADNDEIGYSQDSNLRWGPDFYDCSSFVITAYRNGGLSLDGATYTGNMKNVFLAENFKDVTADVDLETGENMEPGDVLLNEAEHTVIYYDGEVIGARGTSYDKANQISVHDYYNFPWDIVLRYKGGSGKKQEVWKAILKSSYKISQLSKKQINVLKKFDFNDYCKIRYTHDKNKRRTGTNFYKSKLTIKSDKYKIKAVRADGFIIVTYNGGLNNYVNPKLIKEV